MARGQFLHARHLVGQRVVGHVAIPGIVEGLGAPRRTHAVNGHHDEAQFGQRLIVDMGGQKAAAAHRAGLRAGVDVVDDRVLFGRIEVGGLEHHPVQLGPAVARLDRERHRRHPAGSLEAGDVGAGDFGDLGPVGRAAQQRHRRHGGGRIGIDEQLAVRRQRHGVVTGFRREQDRRATVQAGLPQLLVVRVDAGGAADAAEPHGARNRIDLEQLGDVAFAGGDGVLELAGGQVVQVELAPVGALGKPDRLVGLRQVGPAGRAVAAFVLGLDVLGEHRAHLAGGRIGDPEPGILVEARGGDEGQRLAVRCPLHIVPAAIRAATDVIAQRGTMLVRGHLQPGDLSGGHLDHHPLDHGHLLVAGQRIFP